MTSGVMKNATVAILEVIHVGTLRIMGSQVTSCLGDSRIMQKTHPNPSFFGGSNDSYRVIKLQLIHFGGS